MSRIHVFEFLCAVFSATSAFGGPPFLTDDPAPVDFHHWEFYLSSEQEFERAQTNATLPHIEINYGAVPDVQLHIVFPMGYVRTDAGTAYGFADMELGVKYRFVQEQEGVPQIGIFPLLEVPTGNKDRQLGQGNIQAFFPLWVQKSWGKFTTYGGGGYWYAPGEGNRNWAYAGWLLQYDFSDAVTLGGEAYYRTADAPDASPGAGLAFGGYLNMDEHNHILFSVGQRFDGSGLVTGYLGYQLTI